MNRERVDTGFELAGKRLIDHAMAGEPALSSECVSHDIDSEMRFSTRLMSCMTFVLMGFVEHFQAQRREGLGQLPRNGFLHTHHDYHAKSINGGFTIMSIGTLASTRNMSREVCQACAMP